ncbi:MAG: RraA family protein, partial [Gammaproteobacteria bacterium]|nr:RraA family protein [Gammaproteobacteria bacterium]
DTPTICNALELVVPERRLFGYTTEHLFALAPDMAPVVGYARTATLRAATAPAGDPEQVKANRIGYYEYVAQGPGPTVVVIQDLDPVPGYGAFWGEVNTNVHKGLGVRGAVTNGSMRDLPDSAKGFQLLAGKVGPSHAHVHITGMGGDVNIFGMHVKHGDIIHADQHGAVVIPPEAVARIPEAVDLIARREAVVIKAAQSEGFDINKLKEAWGKQSDIH